MSAHVMSIMSPSARAYLMLECSMVALQDDASQEDRYDEILFAMNFLWWHCLEDDEYDALNEVIRGDVQAHVGHARVSA